LSKTRENQMVSRNAFGIHTDVNGVYMPLLKRSALVKVLFRDNEAGIVKGWKIEANPNAYWIARTHLDQDVGNIGELQIRYRSATTEEQARDVGVWYANWIASWALPAGLDYFFWEGGPNEEDDMTKRAVWYSDAFTRRCLEVGLKPASGMYSFGKPGVPKFDGYDGWVQWQSLFVFIESANAGKAQPVAGFQFHEYAMGGDMLGSIDYAIDRYKLSHYRGPTFMGEWGYAWGQKPSSTEAALEQLKAMNLQYGSDDRVCGAALYDIRKNAGLFNWDYMYDDIARALDIQGLPTLPISNFSGGIIEVPPYPDPDPPAYGIKEVVIYQNGCNQRERPTSDSTKLGFIAQGTHLVVQYPPTNDYVRVMDRGWVYVPNLQIIG